MSRKRFLAGLVAGGALLALIITLRVPKTSFWGSSFLIIAGLAAFFSPTLYAAGRRPGAWKIFGVNFAAAVVLFFPWPWAWVSSLVWLGSLVWASWPAAGQTKEQTQARIKTNIQKLNVGARATAAFLAAMSLICFLTTRN